MKTVLYIEDKPHVRENFIKLLGGQLLFFNVMTADTAAEGIDILQKIRVDVVVAGRQLRIEEIDLLDQHLRLRPEIKLIVMADRKSQVANLIKAFEYNIQFETPVDASLLLEMLMNEFQMNYGGQIRGISISAFLQMIELDDKTCALKILSGGKTGNLYFTNGELIAAEMDNLVGKEAALAILALDNPLITLEYNIRTKTRSIEETLMSLLLQSGRIRDEREKKPDERRRYKRFVCHLPVEFVYNEWSYKAIISNISLSGVLLKLKILSLWEMNWTLHFTARPWKRDVESKGSSLRRASNGIGIQLKRMGINQLAVLRTIINEVAGGTASKATPPQT